MAERDLTPATITLDRKRPYRVNDSDRDAVWVGPGKCEVPRWVAEAWGITLPPVTPQQDTEQARQATIATAKAAAPPAEGNLYLGQISPVQTVQYTPGQPLLPAKKSKPGRK